MCDEDGQLAAEFLCQDGLVYEPISKQCGLPFQIDCIGSGRVLLQVYPILQCNPAVSTSIFKGLIISKGNSGNFSTISKI